MNKIQNNLLKEYNLNPNQESLVKDLIRDNHFKKLRELFNYLEVIV